MNGMKRLKSVFGAGYLLWITLFCLGIYPEFRSPQQGTTTRLELTFVSTASAQEKGAREFYPLESTPAEGAEPLEGPLHPLLREDLPIEGQPLEGPIDPETYLLGPGDLLAVFIVGEIEEEILARVAADGSVRFRTLGIFNTRGRFFSEVREEILQAAKDRYRTAEIVVSLVELRNFKASVGGIVWAPGTYDLTATDRVVTLLSRAGGFYNPVSASGGEEVPKLGNYSARRARIIHRDGSVESVDLLLFLRAGLFEGNPYVQDGDFLLVPPLNRNSGVLEIYGAVNHEGLIEYLEGDYLGRALLLAGGPTLEAQSDSVEITRFAGETTEFITFYVDLNQPGASETPLYPDDRIYVRPKPLYHPRHQVEVAGQIMQPGFYPVDEAGTPLLNVIQKAGGFTPRASLKKATLTRTMGVELTDTEYERLRLTPVADMKPLEYEYYKTKKREIKDQVVVDLHALFMEGDSTQNILLHGGDSLHVPTTTQAVNVTGQVKNPGMVAYEPGKQYTYYIEQAGGLSWNASRSRIRVIKVLSGNWIKPKHTVIEDGDTIFIPEKPYVDYWQVYKDVMLVLVQLATLYLVIEAISK